MSHEALIADLQAKSRERIAKFWAEAEAKVEELRQQKNQELEVRKHEVLRLLETEAEKVAAPILHEAERNALSIEDEAMRALSERLYLLANDILERVRQDDYAPFFAELVMEIPSINWQVVRVNPADKELASSFFPEAKIEADEGIIGGFEASADGGRYRVGNLVEKRLEKGWPVMLPKLLKEITGEIDAKPVV